MLTIKREKTLIYEDICKPSFRVLELVDSIDIYIVVTLFLVLRIIVILHLDLLQHSIPEKTIQLNVKANQLLLFVFVLPTSYPNSSGSSSTKIGEKLECLKAPSKCSLG